jgi:hypothetical protein
MGCELGFTPQELQAAGTGAVPAACLVLGLGIDIPNTRARSAKVLFFYSHPWVSLLVGMLLLALCGWGALRLVWGG